MIKIPEGYIAKLGAGYSPETIREDIIEYNIDPRSSILISIGAIGLILGIACWQEFIPNYYIGGGGYLQGVGITYGITCLIMGFLPHLALLLISIFAGLTILVSLLYTHPEEETFFFLTYSDWILLGIAGVLVFILFIDIKYTMKRKRKKVAKEVDQYLKNLKEGIRSF